MLSGAHVHILILSLGLFGFFSFFIGRGGGGGVGGFHLCVWLHCMTRCYLYDLHEMLSRATGCCRCIKLY